MSNTSFFSETVLPFPAFSPLAVVFPYCKRVRCQPVLLGSGKTVVYPREGLGGKSELQKTSTRLWKSEPERGGCTCCCKSPPCQNIAASSLVSRSVLLWVKRRPDTLVLWHSNVDVSP